SLPSFSLTSLARSLSPSLPLSLSPPPLPLLFSARYPALSPPHACQQARFRAPVRRSRELEGRRQARRCRLLRDLVRGGRRRLQKTLERRRPESRGFLEAVPARRVLHGRRGPGARPKGRRPVDADVPAVQGRQAGRRGRRRGRKRTRGDHPAALLVNRPSPPPPPHSPPLTPQRGGAAVEMSGEAGRGGGGDPRGGSTRPRRVDKTYQKVVVCCCVLRGRVYARGGCCIIHKRYI
ncbi:MAG: hypothetical protein BJ554DRAFT_5729, partial [Olpidium bornovanus]